MYCFSSGASPQIHHSLFGFPPHIQTHNSPSSATSQNSSLKCHSFASLANISQISTNFHYNLPNRITLKLPLGAQIPKQDRQMIPLCQIPPCLQEILKIGAFAAIFIYCFGDGFRERGGREAGRLD